MIFVADKVSRQIAQSINENPDEWTGDGYRLSHTKTLISVWIANRAYGLHVEHPGLPRRYGVAMFGSASQQLIWRAVKKWTEGRFLRSLSQ